MKKNKQKKFVKKLVREKIQKAKMQMVAEAVARIILLPFMGGKVNASPSVGPNAAAAAAKNAESAIEAMRAKAAKTTP